MLPAPILAHRHKHPLNTGSNQRANSVKGLEENPVSEDSREHEKSDFSRIEDIIGKLSSDFRVRQDFPESQQEEFLLDLQSMYQSVGADAKNA